MLTTKTMNSGVQALPFRQDSAAAWEDPTSKAGFAVVACILVYLYGSIFARLASQWSHDANFSHGFFVPAFALYVLWDRRETLGHVDRQPAWTGLWLLLSGLLCLVVGALGAELYLSRVSIVPVLGGLVALFLGWGFLRAAAFPWLFLLLMIPPPALVFNQITFPLQIFASEAAANLLPLLGVPVLREGNVIHLPAMALEVELPAEARLEKSDGDEQHDADPERDDDAGPVAARAREVGQALTPCERRDPGPSSTEPGEPARQ